MRAVPPRELYRPSGTLPAPRLDRRDHSTETEACAAGGGEGDAARGGAPAAREEDGDAAPVACPAAPTVGRRCVATHIYRIECTRVNLI